MENRMDMPPRVEIKQRAKEQFAAHRGACIGVLLATVLLSGVLGLLTSVLQGVQGDESGFGYILTTLIVLAVSLFAGTLAVELSYFYLRVYRGKGPTIGDFFAGITRDVGRKIKGVLWEGLFIYLWMLPVLLPLAAVLTWMYYAPMNYDIFLVIAAVIGLMIALYVVLFIKSLSYAMHTFILRDCPQVPVRESLRLSLRMMKGNKGKLFMLDLSFLGWLLFALAPIGAVYLVAPESMGALAIATLISAVIACCFVSPYMSVAQAGFYDALKRASIAAGVISDAEFGPSEIPMQLEE